MPVDSFSIKSARLGTSRIVQRTTFHLACRSTRDL